MRKLVVVIIAVLALFTFIRESLPAAEGAAEAQRARLEVSIPN